MKKEAEDMGIPYLVTPTVTTECEKRVEDMFKFIQGIIRGAFQHVLLRKQLDSENAMSTLMDGSVIEIIREYFLGISGIDGDSKKEKSEHTETWMVKLHEESDAENPITIQLFFTACYAEAEDARQSMRGRLLAHTAKSTDLHSDKLTVDSLGKQLPMIKKEGDLWILSEAALYHKYNGRTILVALDYTDILRNAKEIEATLDLKCSDPLYALHTLNSL
jgi:hypothetical protein